MNFPTSPTNGQTATVNNIVYTYNSANTAWTRTPGIIPDISTGNVSATGFVSAAGNVTGAYIFGNGSQLTGLPAGYANSNAVAYGEAGWAGNIIPSANATYSLGTAANQWKSLYLSNSTLYLANVAINMGSGNVLQVAGSNVVTAGANNAISTAGNITGGNVNAGNITIAGDLISSLGATLTIDPATVGNAGLVVINGNLQVNGTTTTINSNVVSTNDLTVNYANNAINAAAANGGGIEIGPIGSPFITWLYNSTANTFTSSAGISAVGGVTAASVVGGVITGSSSSVTGTVTGASVVGGVITGSSASVTGTVTGSSVVGGVITGTSVSVSGAVTAASVVGGVITGTSTSVSGNTTAGNVLTSGIVSATGNVTGNYILGNGALLSGIITSVSNINNGTSNITVVSSGGNATVSIGGTSNVAVFATTGEYVTGVISATGNITGGNVTTAGLISATSTITSAANITGGNILTAGLVSATANVTGGNVLTAGLVSATGNVTGGNVISGGVRVYKWTTQANTAPTGAVPGDAWYDSYASKLYLYINDGTGNQWVDQSFPTTFANLSVTGNIQGGNVTTTGLVSATGNINANFFVGNGSALTGLSASKIYNGTSEANIGTSGGNANITIGGTSNVVVVATTGIYVTGLASVTGTVTAASTVGGVITGTSLSLSGNTTPGNLLTGGLISATGNITGGNLTVGTGTITSGNIVNSNGNGIGNIGSSTVYFNTVFAKATSAQYADLAEKYLADAEYAPGTVVSFGGAREVTLSQTANDPRIAGVVSSYPAHVMNAGLQDELAVTVALTGRVPASVVGGVLKGDMMVSAGNGFAQACATPAMGTVIGKSLENFHGESGVIEIVVGKL